MWTFVQGVRTCLWMFCSLVLVLRGLSAASFYGDGFVQQKTVESSSKNSLHVRFRTSSASGLLFLATGETDFLWVALQFGHIQAEMDFGSGERTLWSEKGTLLNDLAWHSVELHHDKHNVTLTVDKTSHSSVRMPGPDLELSIQDGLYVGGLDNLDKLYLLNEMSHVGFRGCLDEVLFNEHNLLSTLRPYSGYKMVREVSLGCSTQFSASVTDSISFFSSKAYVSFPTWEVPQEGMFECEFLTSAEDGLLLYSTAGKGDYVALEIRNKHLVGVLRVGGSKTTVSSLTAVNTGKWHAVQLSVGPRTVHLTIGEEMLNSSFGVKSQTLQLSGPFFLGGVDAGTYTEVYRNGLLSAAGKHIAGGSFKGCLKNVRVNDQSMGLPHALVTKDVSVGCEPAEYVPPITTTIPEILQPYTSKSVHHKKPHMFLVLKDLEVLEGGRAPLEAKHIKVNLDFHKLEIKQSQIVFCIEELPVHGQLRLDVDSDEQEDTFSMLDLWHGRIMYVHGGSEDSQDFFMFSVFTSTKKEMPAYLKGNRLHRFNITIMPINDPPELSLPEGNQFILLENSKRPLTTDMLRATDPDTKSQNLLFTLLGDLTADSGFLELEDNPGNEVNTFSYLDLEQGRICFVHTGVKNSRMAIRVGDGDKVSNTVIIRIIAVTLEHKIINNRDIDVIQGESSSIGSRHLAVQVNVPKQAVEIRYDVTELPIYGELQRLHSSGDWKQTNTFTQKLLEKERLRYLSTFKGTQLRNLTDSFRCKINISSVSTDEILVLVRVKWIQYKVTRGKIEVDGDQKVTITPQEFKVVSKVVKLSEDDIHIRLLSLPKRGSLLLNDEPQKENSTFSQRDVTNHHIHYKLFEKPLEDLKDMFSFQVFSKHSFSERHDFRINIKANVDKIVLKNDGLSLLEGQSKVITKKMLSAETHSNRTIFYSIVSSPQHGKLIRINNSSFSTSGNDVVGFSNQDILEEQILYVHDNSETTSDAFTFCVSVSLLKDQAPVTNGTFNISVHLVNDEKPVRIIDKVFHVVHGSQKLLTLEDLRYHDPDSDFDDGQLLYTRRGIPMGELVMVNNTSLKLFQFHQRDLEEKRVLFIHKGVTYGRFVFFVSDGKHYTSSLLEVSAQDPYLVVANNTGLLVQQGQKVTVYSTNFSVTTNIDVRSDNDVFFEIFLPPSHGTLLCDGTEGDAFTQYDLKAGHVVYSHDGSRNLVDSISLTAMVNGKHLDVTMAIRVFLESHQRPPQLTHNQLIVVEEGKLVQISKEELEVIHEDNTPAEIVYTVTTPPSYGFLRRYVGGEHGTGETWTFSQADIDAGHIQYVQVSPGHCNDSFSVNVTNGILTISNQVVLVDIIPLYIPLDVSDITLNEGSSKALTQEVIKISSHHFEGLHSLYHVIEGPHHGRIEHSRIPGVPIPSFTSLQVENKFIFYVHDGSETTADNFTLIVNDTDLHKQSLPRVLHVAIIPVNDEAPVVTTNRILQVWVDSVTQITSDDLSATDLDSPPESLEFIITPPSHGHLALKSAPSRPVLNFTQAHIQHGQMIFVHAGAQSGGFYFRVNDGKNFAPRQIFSITARSFVLSLERNQDLKVFPGSSEVISEAHLLVVCGDQEDTDGNHTIVYSITYPPRLGRLVSVQEGSTDMKPISTFTQNMVNAGLLLYEQTESVDWTARDTFIFTVSSPPASIPPHTFSIHVSYDNTGPEHRSVLLANTGAVVHEGGQVRIEKSYLDASNLLLKLPIEDRHTYEIWFRVTTLPRCGTALIGEQNLTRDEPDFSQSVLSKYGILYVHDDSETFLDSFVFDVWLNPKGNPVQQPQGTDLMVSEKFNITVIPVNDLPPLLRTKVPSISVVEGESVSLGPDNIHVEDGDTLPEDIHYTMVSKPNNWYLALSGRFNETLNNFTQADVNKQRVHFVQNGNLSSEKFYFSISDGSHTPLYHVFSLEVQNITLKMVNNTGLLLLQGQTEGIITLEHLAAMTNKKNATIKFYITTPPCHGRLLKMDQQVIHFVQADLKSGSVKYQMTDLSSSWDRFEFSVLTSGKSFTNQVFNVTIRPLIHFKEHIQIPPGIPVRLERDVLNATELAAITGSDPIFEIIVPPRHAKLVIVTAVNNFESVGSFSFRDVEQGRIAIEEHINFNPVDLQNKTVNAINESFVFILKAANVQPAKGEFVFTVLLNDPTTTEHAISKVPLQPTRLPLLDRTTNVLSFLNQTSQSILTTRAHSFPSKTKPRNRWGNHTRGRFTVPTVPKSSATKHKNPHKNIPVRVESLPRPAADPLLIILPLLACLLLIVILVVLILVFRHRREKRAQSAVIDALPENPQEDFVSQSYQGKPERSITVPSVVVTPLTQKCQRGPVLGATHNASPLPKAAPHDSSMLQCPWTSVDSEGTQQCAPGTPTLKPNQYWV